MKQLVKGLRVNRALLLLSLTQNYISDVGAGMLAEVRDGVGWVGGWVGGCACVFLYVWGGVHWYICMYYSHTFMHCSSVFECTATNNTTAGR